VGSPSELYRQGRLLLDEQVDRIIALDGINDAFAHKPRNGVRTVIDPSL
jgi:Zn-dependent alcohol dehydrogenase